MMLKKISALILVILSIFLVFMGGLGFLVTITPDNVEIDPTVLTVSVILFLLGCAGCIYANRLSRDASKKRKQKITPKPIQQDKVIETVSPKPEPLTPHNSVPLTPRRMAVLYKLATHILEDHVVELDEVHQLDKWFKQYPESCVDTRTEHIYNLVERVLADGVLDKNEELELYASLSDFCDLYEHNELKVNRQNKPTSTPSKKSSKKQKQAKSKSKMASRNASDQVSVSDSHFIAGIDQGDICMLDYCDLAGNITNRTIRFQSQEMGNNGNTYIKAYCLKRKASRTFRVDSILSLCNKETGEVYI